MVQEIKVIPFSATIKSGSSSKQIAQQFESTLNANVGKGWDYYETRRVKVEIAAGCLGSLLGQRSTYTNHILVVFAKGQEIITSQLVENEIDRYKEKQSIANFAETDQKKSTRGVAKNAQKSKQPLKNWHKNSLYALIAMASIILGGLYYSFGSQNTTKTFGQLKLEFSDLYKEKEWNKADAILMQLEEQAPNSKYVTSARKALDKRLQSKSQHSKETNPSKPKITR